VLPVRYAILTQELGNAGASKWPSRRVAVAHADAISARLKTPLECRDAARLAARFVADAARADALAPARVLDVIVATDALRRSERLDWLIDSACAHAAAEGAAECAAPVLREALAVVRSVDASAIARDAIARAAGQSSARRSAVGDAIGVALRKARLAALRRWRKTGRTDS
jgi:tRNA nucleotidyltransferase (CCA-adding enzyme)